MSSNPGYTKVVRRSLGVSTYRTVWKGEDHLLLVTSNGYTERYQRFQYADIRTFFIQPAERHVYFAATWIVLALIAAIFAWITLQKGSAPFFSGPLLLISVGAILWNYLLGPACRFYIVTRVQTLRFPIHRLRRAHAFLDQIGPEIAAAQSVQLGGLENAPGLPPPIIS